MLRDGLGRNRPLHELELVDQRGFQHAPHALGLGAVEEIVAREEARPRIGQRAAQRMRAGQHPLARGAQQILEFGRDARLISCAAHSKGQPQDALRLAPRFHGPAGTKRPAGARDGAGLAASRDDRDPDAPAGREGPGGAVRERRARRRHALRTCRCWSICSARSSASPGAWTASRDELREVGETLAFLRQPEPPGGWREALDMLPLLRTVMAMKPQDRRHARPARRSC